MIEVVEIPDRDATFDAFEEGLILPVPAYEENSILLEARDGSNVQRIVARGASFSLDGMTVHRVNDVKIQVFLTDARVALSCSKFNKGGGWIGGPSAMIVLNSVSKARAAMKRRGKMLVGQVRYPWLKAVGSTSRIGRGSEERLILEVQAPGPDKRLIRLQVELPKDVDAARVAAEVARRGAAYRLASESELAEEERAGLEALCAAVPLPADRTSKNTIVFHRFPTHWPIGSESARFAPSQVTTDSEA